MSDHDWKPFPGAGLVLCDRCGVLWDQDESIWQRPHQDEELTEMPACSPHSDRGPPTPP